MLKRLTIQNYALIENLDIEFPQGLVIITGETGAGKSIMLGALSLLLGGKGDVSALKDSQKNCGLPTKYRYSSGVMSVYSGGSSGRYPIQDLASTGSS